VFADRVAALDIHLFAHIKSQTSDSDRRSLLAVHDAIAARAGTFSYLEIGSYMGGTLQVVIADPRCTRVVSIDPRPQWPPDDRPGATRWEYPDNSTERMRELLQGVPGADLAKLETIEASTESIDAGQFARPDFCFIDGEHTYAAALRDARFCRTVMQGTGIIAFHDLSIIERAILDFLRETPRPHRGYELLGGEVFIVELGGVPTMLRDPGVRSQQNRPRRDSLMAGAGAFLDTWLLATDLRRRQRAARITKSVSPT
jgi:hypothetical protein